jgi:chorismate--pyruvate lyase
LNDQITTFRFRAEPVWLPACRAFQLGFPGEVASWLFDNGSLTRRLIDACPGQFCVQVLAEGMTLPMANEGRRLAIAANRHAFVRQVQLMCDDTPWVFARTVIPRSTLTGSQRILTHLGSRPLGAYLFADPHMQRDPVEIARLAPGDHLYHMAVEGLPGKPACVWGRRTVFYLDNKPLLVNEIFLPGVTRCKNT